MCLCTISTDDSKHVYMLKQLYALIFTLNRVRIYSCLKDDPPALEFTYIQVNLYTCADWQVYGIEYECILVNMITKDAAGNGTRFTCLHTNI